MSVDVTPPISISADMPSGTVNPGKLHREILASAITAVIENVSSEGDVLTVTFDVALNAGNQTIFDNNVRGPAGGLLAAHDITPPISEPEPHAPSHTDGTDDIQDAAAGQKGLATTTQITKLDGVATDADVTGDNPPQTHAHTHASTTGQGTDDHHDKLHSADHGPAGADALKLDDLAAPGDNTDLDSSTAEHGLLLKLAGGTTLFLRADGAWAAPTAASKVKVGTYTGDGSTSQGITGVGFLPKYLRIWTREITDGSQVFIFETTTNIVNDNAAGGAILVGDKSSDHMFETDRIISLDTDGFTVDDAAGDRNPNTSGVVYNFLAIG